MVLRVLFFGVLVPGMKHLVHSVLEMQTDRSVVLDVYVILASTLQGLPHLVCDVRRGGVGSYPRRSLGLALIELP